MTKKKIIHLSQDTGGVKTYVAHVLEYVDPTAFEFVVLAPENSGFQAFCRSKNVQYFDVDLHRGNNPVKNILILIKIIGIIRKQKPAIIHAHSAKGGFLGRLAAWVTGTKVIYTPHAFSYLPFTGIKRMIFFFLELLAKKWTNVLLAISYSEANRAIYELGYSKKYVKVILNSIPVNEFNSTYEECLNIRMIGRLTSQKNHFLFLDIAKFLLKKYPDLQFSILGAGIHDELSEDIKSYIEANGLAGKINIQHWGESGTSESFLKSAHVFVMTSVFEGLPFSLLEAMSFGIPCVVSKVDGNTDVIDNWENGFACLTPEQFASKIELLINDKTLRKRIGLAGSRYIREFHNLQTNVKVLEQLYADL